MAEIYKESWIPDAAELAKLRTILHTFKKYRDAPSQKVLAGYADFSEDTLQRFLNPDGVRKKKDGVETEKKETTPAKLNPDLIAEQARAILNGMDQMIVEGRFAVTPSIMTVLPFLVEFFPHHEKALMRKEGENDVPIVPSNARIVLDPAIHQTKLPYYGAADTLQASAIRALEGFWYILRPASQPDKDAESLSTLKLSLSLMRIIPRDVETANGYPVFKMRQAGNTSKDDAHPFDFSGVISPGGKRAVFVGREADEDKFFAMIAKYRLPKVRADVSGHLNYIEGTMLGITSELQSVGAPFVAFYIPGTDSIDPDIEDDAFDKFERPFRDRIDTVDVKRARECLEIAKVEIGPEDWERTLNHFRARRTFVV